MSPIKKAMVTVLCAGFGLIAAGCGEEPKPKSPKDPGAPTPIAEYSSTSEDLYGAVVKFNGAAYNCIVFYEYKKGGLWCERVS